MKVGTLVYVIPSDTTTGVVIGPDLAHPNTQFKGPTRPTYHRTMVLFDDDVFSVPTFQLEVISESR